MSGRQAGKRLKTAEEAYYEGIGEGVNKGLREGKRIGAEAGFVKGWMAACDHFLDVLEQLDQVPDIGPKRYQKIIERFDYQEKADFAKENRWKIEQELVKELEKAME